MAHEITDAFDVVSILSPGNGRNAVVLFYKHGCSYCERFLPVFNRVAYEVRARHDLTGVEPPVEFYRINLPVAAQKIRQFTNQFVASFPSIAFKNAGDERFLWGSDFERPRTKAEFERFLSVFFEPRDESLASAIAQEYGPDLAVYQQQQAKRRAEASARQRQQRLEEQRAASLPGFAAPPGVPRHIVPRPRQQLPILPQQQQLPR